MTYDSTQDTLGHIARVRFFLDHMQYNLTRRAKVHDASKLVSPEKEVFDLVTPELRALTYGSKEYKKSLAKMGRALSHHYKNNSHHPEHFDVWACPLCNSRFDFVSLTSSSVMTDGEGDPLYLCPKCCSNGTIMEATLEKSSGISGMTLFDILEMLADWKAATERHADGNLASSLDINVKRFCISPEMEKILRSTIAELGW